MPLSWRRYDDGYAIPQQGGADSIATNGGKHKPLDDGEIQRLCKRISEMARRGNAASLRRHSNNGAGMQKHPKLRDDKLGARDLYQHRQVLRDHAQNSV